VVSALLGILAWPTLALAGANSAAAALQAGPSDARVVTLTYLKSAPGKLSQLERYVADLGRIVEGREVFERAPFLNLAAAIPPPGGAGPDAGSADEAAIRAVVGKYFEGGMTGKPGPIREAFLPSARIEGLRGDQLVTWSLRQRNSAAAPAIQPCTGAG